LREKLVRKGLIEKVGGDVVSEFPGFRRAKVREHDDADPLSWIALDAAGKASTPPPWYHSNFPNFSSEMTAPYP